MKIRNLTDRSFFAKMLLLFALLLLGYVQKRGGLSETMKTMFGSEIFRMQLPDSGQPSLVSQLQR